MTKRKLLEERKSRRKLSDHEVLRIRQLAAEGWSAPQIRSGLDLSQIVGTETIRRVIRGETNQHVALVVQGELSFRGEAESSEERLLAELEKLRVSPVAEKVEEKKEERKSALDTYFPTKES